MSPLIPLTLGIIAALAFIGLFLYALITTLRNRRHIHTATSTGIGKTNKYKKS